MRRSQLGDGDGPAFQVANRAHALRPEQLETTGVDAACEDDGGPRVELRDERRDERHAEVDLAGRQSLVDPGRSELRVAHVGKALTPQELLCHILRSNADPW